MERRSWEPEKPRNLEAMGWALAWYRVDRQETRKSKSKSKSERSVYFTPKSSTTKTKSVGWETCLNRQGVEVSKKPKEEKRDEAKVGEFARLLEAVHRLVIRKTM